MTEVGTASSTKNTNGTAIFGNGRNAGSISLKDKNNKTVSIQSHDTISSSYKIIMPQSIGTADEVLKISSVSGTNAVCEWGTGGGGGGGGSGIVNNRIDGDLTIGEDDSEILTIASKININGNEKTLPNKPFTSDKGKIVTVNAAGDDLEYGPQVLKHNVVHKNSTTIDVLNMPTARTGYVHPEMFIEITPQLTSSKIMITVNITGEFEIAPHNSMAYLKRTVSGSATYLLPPVDNSYSAARGLGQFVPSHISDFATTMDVCNFHYIDQPSTTQEVRYDVILISGHSSQEFKYNAVRSTTQDETLAEVGFSFMSAEEKFANDDNSVGAITSFTQEQALAGAGGTATFTASSPTGSAGVGYAHDNVIRTGGSQLYFGDGQTTVSLVYDFATPQIVTNYKICPRSENSTENWKTWELRAAVDSNAYDNGNSVLLDSQNFNSLSDWGNINFSFTSSVSASDNLSLFTTFPLSTIGAYKYYRFNVTASFHATHKKVSEVVLYGGGFTIPSQIGNAGKQLITNGTSLSWGSPSSILVPSPTGNANKVLQANSAGNALEYMEGGSIIQTSHRLERGEHSKTLNKTNYNPDANDYQINSNFKVGFTPTNSNSILRFSCDFNIGTSQANMWLLFHLYRRINGGTWVRINVNNTTSPGRRSTFLAAPRIEVAFSGPGSLGSVTHQQLRNMQGEYFDNNWSSSWTSGQSVEYTIYWQYLYGPTGNGTMYLNRTHSNEDWGSTSSTLTLQELNHSNTTLSS